MPEQVVHGRVVAGFAGRQCRYIIDAQWLSQGVIWCQVTWLGHHGDTHALHAQAYLRCGEDTLREYHVLFELAQGRLVMRWSEDFKTRALRRR